MTNPIADICVPELGRQVDLLDYQDVDQSALDVCTLTLNLRQQYRRALLARDQAAASLVRRSGWSPADVAEVICGHRAHAHRAATIVDWTGLRHAYGAEEAPGTEQDLYQHQQVVADLHELLERAYDQATRLLPAVRLERNLPDGPTERVAHCAHWLRFVEGLQAANDASRILYAAVLARHHGWPETTVAELAGVTVDEVRAAMTAAEHHPPSDADSILLERMAQLAWALDYNAGRLTALRDEAVRECRAGGVPSQIIAAHVGLPDQVRVAVVA
ncbi:hypothetical protein Cs7R123_65250 [Catellatospora sp. TT07R-123]|uniref:hypothetical protein n=1 Tax=Catellatospora sp. TT07R-123 TaxID=2733863 RepID=UPI001B2892B6|nr:hypothetical protein [Catellatospora sp. TT07R-123]GHJ49183.1 hypothetical protein Cs7R123_65250 [Catellatospora sp. TT07R-123]